VEGATTHSADATDSANPDETAHSTGRANGAEKVNVAALVPCPIPLSELVRSASVPFAELTVHGINFRYVVCPNESLPFANNDLVPGVYEGGIIYSNHAG
jgi:hypothetical protein